MRAPAWRAALALLALCLLAQALAVDPNKFRKCKDTGFCRRHRSRPAPCRYSLSGAPAVSEKAISGALVPDGPSCRDLLLSVQLLQSGSIRTRILERSPLDGAARWEPSEVLLEGGLKEFAPHAMSEAEVRSARLSPEADTYYFNMTAQIVALHAKPFSMGVYQRGKLVMTVNENQRLYFEHTRLRNEAAQVTASSGEQKTDRKIVSYTEAGEAVYEDGSVERLPAAEVPAVPASNEDGEWEESFGGFTDSKPHGPQSVGLSLHFYDVKNVYGLPSHAADYAMRPTVPGAKGSFEEPYRLYNLDVFEFENESPAALYGSIPFLLGAGPEGAKAAFLMNPTEMFVDIGANQKDVIESYWMAEAGMLDLFLFAGPSLESIYASYAELTSRPPIPPMFSLGYHQSRWNYVDQQDVLEVHRKFEELNFPYDVIWLDIEHTDGKRYFTYNPNAFQSPVDMQNELGRYGHKMVNIIDPHIKVDSNYHVDKKVQERNLCIRDASGQIYVGHCWPGSSHYIDYLNPESQTLWNELMSYSNYASTPHLFVWNDMNEPSVFNGPEVSMPKDCKTPEGLESRYWHNVYGFHYNKVNYNALIARNPGANIRPFVLTRAYFAGSQRFSAAWTGDVKADFPALRQSIPMILSSNAAGLSFIGADVPGFFGNPTDELYVRWYEASAWTPFYRAHAHIESARREPWLRPEAVFNTTRATVIERYQYLPYWYTQFAESHKSGMPIMRGVWMVYPREKEAYGSHDMFLVGRDMLVHPIVSEGVTSVSIKFPGSESWYEIHTGQLFSGRATVKTPLSSIPVFQRAGSIVPQKQRVRRSTEHMLGDPYTLVVVLDSVKEATGKLYLDDRKTFDYERKGLFCMKGLAFSKGSLESRSMGECKYASDERVERITIVGSLPVNRVSIRDQDGVRSLTFTYDEAHRTLTIRKPDCRATGDWTISLS